MMSQLSFEPQTQRTPDGILIRLLSVSFGRFHRVPIESYEQLTRRSHDGAALNGKRIMEMYQSFLPTIMFSVCHYGYYSRTGKSPCRQAFGVSAEDKEFRIRWRNSPGAVPPKTGEDVQNGRMMWRGIIPERLIETWEFPSPPAAGKSIRVHLYPAFITPGQLDEYRHRRKYTVFKLPNSQEWRRHSVIDENTYFEQQHKR